MEEPFVKGCVTNFLLSLVGMLECEVWSAGWVAVRLVVRDAGQTDIRGLPGWARRTMVRRGEPLSEGERGRRGRLLRGVSRVPRACRAATDPSRRDDVCSVGLLDLADRPAEPGELAGGGDGDQGAAFIALLQSCPGAVQAALRGPGDRDRLGWLAGLSFGERGADPRDVCGSARPASTSSRRACVEPVLVIDPSLRCWPLLVSEGTSPTSAHRSSSGCLDRRRERATIACPVEGHDADQPLPAVVRCRKRQQDVAPVEGLSMSTRNGTSWSGRCEGPDRRGVRMGSNYAGVDWASEKHDVLVADEAGEELLAATFAHDERGLRSLCRALVRLEVELVAIERPDGLLVERLLDAGLRVLALHPNQVAAARDRGFAPRAASPTGSTRSCCASWRAPIIIASGCSSPTATRPRRCGR